MSNREWRNRDYLKRLNYPRQTYALSGTDWGDTTENADRENEKLVINGAPMIITPIPPGAHAYNDEVWRQTYGASMDSFLSIFDGENLLDGILSSAIEFGAVTSVLNRGLPTSKNMNIYDILPGGQQIQYVTSKDTVDEARGTVTYGFLDEVRSICIRGPMHLSGWGKTIAMRPTDPDPQDKRLNDDEHKLDRSTWKTAPVDLRWDDRRKVWRGFNDLIVDDYGQNLGTFVHSTNPDETCGFPFLRTKLEDVFAVRKTIFDVGTEGASRKDDTTKSATLSIRIDSLTFDGTNLVAPLDDIFKITDKCFSGLSATCGPETTTFAQLSIKTPTLFYANDNVVGPISFVQVQPDDIITGAMYYEGDGPCGQWVPGIPINICDIGSEQFTDIWNNDNNLSSALLATCAGTAFNQDFVKSLITIDSRTATQDSKFADDSVKSGFTKIENWSDAIRVDIANEISKSVFNAYKQLATNTQSTLDIMYNDIIAKFNTAITAIQISLLESCECTFEFIPVEGIAPKIPLGGLALPDLDRDLGLEPEIDAAEFYITKVDARESDVVDLESTFDETPPSPVSIRIEDPCSTKFFTNNTCQIRS